MKTRRESMDTTHSLTHSHSHSHSHDENERVSERERERGRQRLQEISDMREEWREERENNITLLQQPAKTLRLCGLALCHGGQTMTTNAVSHPTVLRVVVPSLLLWLLLTCLPGLHQEYIQFLNFCVEYFIWWLGLGILSSVGLGNGLPTGVMFLFPHILQVCLTAQLCGTIDFKHFDAIWFRTSPDLFKCPVAVSESDVFTPATFLNVWLIILIPSFIQATGTCIGEIPPYWMARASRLAVIEAGEKGESKGDIPEELEVNSQYWIVNKVKAKMISFLRSYGFLGIFLMAAWPNFAFDLCGICCGHFLMPFWVFFGATFLGKGCVRTIYQTLFFTALSSEKYLDKLIKFLQYLAPDSLDIDKFIHDTLHDLKLSAKHGNSAVSATSTESSSTDKQGSATGSADSSGSVLETFVFLWQIFMLVVLAFFVISLMQHSAQYYQSILDAEKEKKLTDQLSGHILKNVSSPTSGRIHLPPPTPKKTQKSSPSSSPVISTRHTSKRQTSPNTRKQLSINTTPAQSSHTEVSVNNPLFQSPSKLNPGGGLVEMEKGNNSAVVTDTIKSADNDMDISKSKVSAGVSGSGSSLVNVVGGYLSAVKAYRASTTKQL